MKQSSRLYERCCWLWFRIGEHSVSHHSSDCPRCRRMAVEAEYLCRQRTRLLADGK